MSFASFLRENAMLCYPGVTQVPLSQRQPLLSLSMLSLMLQKKMQLYDTSDLYMIYIYMYIYGKIDIQNI